MKKYISIVILASLLFSACSNNQSKDDSKKENTELEEKTDSNIGEAKDCDEFIDQYEKWMDDYIKVIEKYMKNPTEATQASEYMNLTQEGIAWMNQWNGKLYYCASRDKYQKRFDEIAEKAEKKLKELGIE